MSIIHTFYWKCKIRRSTTTPFWLVIWHIQSSNGVVHILHSTLPHFHEALRYVIRWQTRMTNDIGYRRHFLKLHRLADHFKQLGAY